MRRQVGYVLAEEADTARRKREFAGYSVEQSRLASAVRAEDRAPSTGRDPHCHIRERDVTEGASRISVHPKVREWMVSHQRAMGAGGGVVMEGRDIGTKVFPDADLKIFLDADPVVREWIERNLGPIGRIQGAMSGAGELARHLTGLPIIAARAVAVLEQLETMTRDGITLSPETIAAMGRTEGRKNRWRTVALWVIAVIFIGILFAIRQL